MSLLERVVVTYWKILGGGLAAPVVMLCHYKGQEVFEEYMDKERWKTYKETTNWGQLPLYTLEYRKGTLQEDTGDKVVFTNSVPALRMIGNIFGLYFTELKQNLKYEADMWIDVSTDCMRTIYPTFKLGDEEKVEARKKLMEKEGKLYSWFNKFDNKLSEILGENKELNFLVNNTISIADFHLFSTLNSITCGWLDGINKDFMKQFEYLNAWFEGFLKHYQEVLKSNPKKDEYPYIVHNGRYYVYGKDQTEFFANKDNHIPEEEVKKMNFVGVGCNNEATNIKMTQEKAKELNINLENEVKNEVEKEMIVLNEESTIKEVDEASVKMLINTLKVNNVSFKGVTEKRELISMVKEVLISKSRDTQEKNKTSDK